MANEWRMVSLNEIADILTGFPFPGGEYTNGDGTRVVRGENVTIGTLRWDTVKGWNGSLESLDAYYLCPKDIVIGMDGSRVGMNRAQVRESDLPLLLAQRVARVRAKHGISQDYLAYCIKDDSFYRYVESIKTGTSIPHISSKQISKFQVNYPTNIKHQQAIVHILGTLDDKIELLRQMNETIEAMARALFKSWFIDFDPVRKKAEGQPTGLPPEIDALFPDSFEDSELGEIPKGWSIVPLEEIASLQTSSIAPYERPDHLFTHYSIPAYDYNKMPSKELGEQIKSNKYKVIWGTILVSKLNPETPRIWIPSDVGESSICSTEFMQFLSYNDTQHFLYLLLSSQPVYNEILNRVNGSTGSRQRAQPSQVVNIPVLVAPLSLQLLFEKKVAVLFDKQNLQKDEIQTETRIRNLLLSRLISGDLELSEKMISKILEPAK
jgi:type I restriction enzyme S subunit